MPTPSLLAFSQVVLSCSVKLFLTHFVLPQSCYPWRDCLFNRHHLLLSIHELSWHEPCHQIVLCRLWWLPQLRAHAYTLFSRWLLGYKQSCGRASLLVVQKSSIVSFAINFPVSATIFPMHGESKKHGFLALCKLQFSYFNYNVRRSSRYVWYSFEDN